MSAARFAPLQARLQALHGQRLDATQWNRLAAVAALDPFLARARETSLELWLRGVDGAGDVHHIEAMVREAFLRHVAMVAGWSPKPWQPAVRWVATWPDLAAALHRRRHGADHDWIRRIDGLEQQELPPTGHDPLDWWLERWQTLWPPQSGLHPPLKALIQLARRTPHGNGATWDDWWMQRTTLELRFRRHAMEPGALFIHLWLTALDLYRLRGELCRRRLFPPLVEQAA
ncbi:MAG: hypothetical protein HQL91_00225 [Magnetococcales bacterium]|nr:hypothetical protein [Magnetococcales bacterium]